MLKYNPNPKHESPGAPGRRGSRLDLSPSEASLLLNHPVSCVEVPGKRQFVGVHGEKIYVFQGNETDGYHAYPSSGNEVYTKYPEVANQIAALLSTTVKRLSRMHD